MYHLQRAVCHVQSLAIAFDRVEITFTFRCYLLLLVFVCLVVCLFVFLLLSINETRCHFNSVKIATWAVPAHTLAHNVLRAILFRRDADDLHTSAPLLCQRHKLLESLWRSEGIVKTISLQLTLFSLLLLSLTVVNSRTDTIQRRRREENQSSR